mmetsp:Transcript_39361/g.116688  ORF Transcript_39361/g.116688 Transcript_39361/m.116688 type:complete len:200 (-) Transcript_39361:9-608(-)
MCEPSRRVPSASSSPESSLWAAWRMLLPRIPIIGDGRPQVPLPVCAGATASPPRPPPMRAESPGGGRAGSNPGGGPRMPSSWGQNEQPESRPVDLRSSSDSFSEASRLCSPGTSVWSSSLSFRRSRTPPAQPGFSSPPSSNLSASSSCPNKSLDGESMAPAGRLLHQAEAQRRRATRAAHTPGLRLGARLGDARGGRRR